MIIKIIKKEQQQQKLKTTTWIGVLFLNFNEIFIYSDSNKFQKVNINAIKSIILNINMQFNPYTEHKFIILCLNPINVNKYSIKYKKIF